jgi:hypothetical protein
MRDGRSDEGSARSHKTSAVTDSGRKRDAPMPYQCTGRSAPRHFRRWSAATGWQTPALRRSRRLRSRRELLRACVPWSCSPPSLGVAYMPSGTLIESSKVRILGESPCDTAFGPVGVGGRKIRKGTSGASARSSMTTKARGAKSRREARRSRPGSSRRFPRGRNSRSDSWRGTAGGSPRRSRSRRAARSRS